MKYPMMDNVPPITAMVHVASYCLLIAYCDDMRLRLFGDHHQGEASAAIDELLEIGCEHAKEHWASEGP